ncbi:MAG: hypothetical protein KGP28_02690 [Bdellovibrionales bacterium]|nr:hypothetical protein [Bdellovibrionales bacterium]
MGQDENAPPKKDLTGIMDLPQADPVKDPNAPEGADSLEFNEIKPIEQIDDFASLDQIGMMDHPVVEEQVEPELSLQPDPSDPFQNLTTDTPGDTPSFPESTEPPLSADPFSSVDETPPFDASLSGEPLFLKEMTEAPETFDAAPVAVFSEPPVPPKPVLDDLKTYAESKKEAVFDPGTRNEFHLMISGDFDPYSRDKLLLFLTENSIGITSSELDFQIKSRRVLMPRVSEFSGIKLIQDLRDSGLSFILKKSEEASLIADDGNSKSYHFEVRQTQKPLEVPILPSGEVKAEEYRVLDSIRMVQFLRAEILEVEQSDLFQELLDRMTEALRKRAKLKGANALTHLSHKITPLRLPSQYQIEMSASLLKRI